jgi:hypothetical protein
MDALYRDFILDHYKNPRNFGELPRHDLDFHDHNPLCGDELGVHIVVEDGKVKDLRFHGQGCAISQAAASIAARRRATRAGPSRPVLRHPGVGRLPRAWRLDPLGAGTPSAHHVRHALPT